MTLTAGTIQRLRVDREVSPYGYFLTDEEHDVILHYTELTRDIMIDEELDVFLFYDTEDRLASTMKKPYLTLGEVAALEVADIHSRFGYFLEMGIGRQLMLPASELPELKTLRPIIGDKVYVKLAHDRVGRLVAELAGEEELAPLVFHAPSSWLNTWHEAVVYRALRMGTFFVVEGGPLGFGALGLLHESQRPQPLRVGDRVRVRIAHVREDGRVNVTLAERKEVGMDLDANRLLQFLKERPNGAMPYSDETPSDLITQRFQISKSAFKRAMGRLMKAGFVTQEGSWSKLTELGSATDTAEAEQKLAQIQAEQRRPDARRKPSRPSDAAAQRSQSARRSADQPGTTSAERKQSDDRRQTGSYKPIGDRKQTDGRFGSNERNTMNERKSTDDRRSTGSGRAYDSSGTGQARGDHSRPSAGRKPFSSGQGNGRSNFRKDDR